MLSRLLIAPIRWYRRWLSPLKRTPSCRYLPTCSEYAIEAIQKRGAWWGGLMALFRILRCNPLFHGGYHPVTCSDDHRPRAPRTGAAPKRSLRSRVARGGAPRFARGTRAANWHVEEGR